MADEERDEREERDEDEDRDDREERDEREDEDGEDEKGGRGTRVWWIVAAVMILVFAAGGILISSGGKKSSGGHPGSRALPVPTSDAARNVVVPPCNTGTVLTRRTAATAAQTPGSVAVTLPRRTGLRNLPV